MLQHLPTNKSVVQKVGVQCYISDSSVQATLPASLCPRMQTAVWQVNQIHCQLCSAVTLHCVVLSQFNNQIQTTATTPSPSQMGISTGDQPVICNTAPSSLFGPQYYSTAVLEQTAYCKGRGSLSDTVLRKGCTPHPECMH